MILGKSNGWPRQTTCPFEGPDTRSSPPRAGPDTRSLQYKTLDDVVGTHTQWPIHLVLLDEENVKIRSPRQNKPIKDPSVDLSATATPRLDPLVGENVFMLLGKNCKRLVKTLTSFLGDKEYIDMDLDSTVFHHGNVNGVC
nr:uncharacterized protein LOC109183092 [Ipomoea batatas]